MVFLSFTCGAEPVNFSFSSLKRFNNVMPFVSLQYLFAKFCIRETHTLLDNVTLYMLFADKFLGNVTSFIFGVQ
jgi:hypothetical protein